ncbi:MAG TPA: SGNH/GDSL hydrolase family protein [Planctomycetota bacterium]|nr:SGNH/GDSL hydrolase family protein [Planctomycetota bacterium]
MERREFLRAVGGVGAIALAGAALGAEKAPPPTPPAKDPDAGLTWHDIRDWGVEGKGWADTERPFGRLPTRAKEKVRPAVWSLSRSSAGMCVRFQTDATAISARWTLLSPNLAMDHMPATGVSGLDLYARDDAGRWRWLAVGRPKAVKTQARLVGGLPPGKRAYTLYLPLYNGVESVEIGLDPKAAVEPLPPRATKPMVFYGTSILQGGCASRPGMVHTAILGRRLDRAAINLGFSGNGTMDPEIADLMAELDACVYVVDCLPNMAAAAVAERTGPLVRTLRGKHAKTPIVLVEDRTYASAWLLPSQRSRNETSRTALRKAFDALVAAGVEGLHLVQGERLLGDDAEATVDGSHPTDLGFVRMADALEPVLKPLV